MRAIDASVAFVCPPDHKHGETDNCYTGHGCRCAESCRAAATRRTREARRLRAYGRWDRSLVSPWRATAHIFALSRFGYSQERIARVAGINARTVYKIANGHQERIEPRVHAAILSIRPSLDHLEPGALISAEPSLRRVQALARIGWSVTAIAAEMGLTRGALSQRVHAPSTTVASHRQLAEVYERLWNSRPADITATDAAMVTRTKRYAAAAGWVPPLGWDDIDTDPAPPVPEDIDSVDEVAIESTVSGYYVALTRDERLIALGQLHARGYLDGELAQMLHVDKKTIGRDRAHLGLAANYFAREEAAA